MTDQEIKDAMIAALQNPQTGKAVADSVQKAVQAGLQTSLPDVVKGALKDAKQAEFDPYRTTLHFLAGLTAFCLAVIVGLFNAFPDPPVDTGHVVYRMFGGVLAWIAAAALAATVCMLIAQLRKHLYRVKQKQGLNPAEPRKRELVFLMGIPTVPGALAVAYCVSAGAAILNGDTGLIGIADALCGLVRF